MSDYVLGDIVRMKKQHPCGSYEWEITRVGADIKIRCIRCDHVVMLPRIKFEKGIKKIVGHTEPKKRIFFEEV